ncbi:hypothetical protein HY227_02395 [Candidatus Wolfebacteria bacterium]|nr:hypothetical protein [Candidatus Wolfebacteria bacterium]
MKKLLLISLAVVLISPVFVKAVTVEELLAKIQALTQQINELKAQLAQVQQGTTAWCHDFNTNLGIGYSGSEMVALARAIENDKDHTYNGTPAVGVYDEMTASTVVEFQEKYREEILTPVGLQHGTGYVGKSTRAKLNKLYGCGGNAIPNPAPTPKPISCPQYAPPSDDFCVGGKIVSSGRDENGCAQPPKCVSQTSCVKEGESLGAVVPGNNLQCCAGFVAQIPEGLVGGRGTCVKSTSTPSITVLSPNGGENWKVGETHAIKWSSKYSSMAAYPTITIKLTDTRPTANILPNTALIDKVFDTGSYDWKIPSKLGSISLGGNTYKVKIERDIGNVGVDIDSSDSTFIIGYLPD